MLAPSHHPDTISVSLVPQEFRSNLLTLLRFDPEVRALVVAIIAEEHRRIGAEARRQLEEELSQQFAAFFRAGVEKSANG